MLTYSFILNFLCLLTLIIIIIHVAWIIIRFRGQRNFLMSRTSFWPMTYTLAPLSWITNIYKNSRLINFTSLYNTYTYQFKWVKLRVIPYFYQTTCIDHITEFILFILFYQLVSSGFWKQSEIMLFSWTRSQNTWTERITSLSVGSIWLRFWMYQQKKPGSLTISLNTAPLTTRSAIFEISEDLTWRSRNSRRS